LKKACEGNGFGGGGRKITREKTSEKEERKKGEALRKKIHREKRGGEKSTLREKKSEVR